MAIEASGRSMHAILIGHASAVCGSLQQALHNQVVQQLGLATVPVVSKLNVMAVLAAALLGA